MKKEFYPQITQINADQKKKEKNLSRKTAKEQRIVIAIV